MENSNAQDLDGPVAEKVSILIVTYNRKPDVLRCLQSIERQTWKPAEVVVFDNASADGSAAAVRAQFPFVKIIESGKNFGCPGGRNRGISACSREYVFCVDDDGELNETAVETLANQIEQLPGVAVIAGVVKDPFHAPVEGQKSGPAFTFSGGVAAIHRETFLALGGYHEDGLREGEETELSYRLHANNKLVYRDAHIILDHHVDGGRERRRKVIRSSARQSLLTAIKVAPAPLLAPILCWKSIQHIRNARRYHLVADALRGLKDATLAARSAIRARNPVSFRTFFAGTRWYTPPAGLDSTLVKSLNRPR